MTLTTIGAGVGACAGFVPEANYGAVVASPAWTFIEPNAITHKKHKTTKQSSGLAAGRYVDLASRRVVVERSATLELPLDWCQGSHMTTLLNQISSTYTAGTAGSQAAGTGIYSAGARLTPAAPVYSYAHTFRNSIAGRSATWQLGIPTTDGVLRQYDLLGSKPTKFNWACKAGELLTCQTSWDARYQADPLIDATYPAAAIGGGGQSPYAQATPSYAVATPWHFANAQIQIGTSIANASTSTPVDGVTGFDLAVERKLKTGRQYYGNAGIKNEPITSDVLTITGQIHSDFLNKTYFADAFYSDTPLFVIVTFGVLSATTPALQFVLSNVYLDGDSPAASNKDVVTTSFPFRALYDLVNEPLSVIIQSTDATV